ncbi:S8 family serine peptidase [Flavobacterium sp.]|uniref:S8 family serine peptidase n=1 Tax=Flavobacterium sp. TaxID=239 RepID=UPI0039E46DCF
MKLKLTLAAALLSTALFAQQHYYDNGKKIPLTVDRKLLNICVDQDFDVQSLEGLAFLKTTVNADRSEFHQDWIAVQLAKEPTLQDYSALVARLRKIAGVRAVSPYFYDSPTISIGTSNLFHVKLKNAGDSALLEKVAQKHHASVLAQNKYMPEWFTLQVDKKADSNAVEMTNAFYETGLFAAVDPGFMFDFNTAKNDPVAAPGNPGPQDPPCTNDPEYGNQWGLRNATNLSIDINACQAWTVSVGTGIKVAVIDTGIKTNHADIDANIVSTQNFSGNPTVPISLHGTHVAGIVGAEKGNSLRIAGVAPNAGLMNIIRPDDLTASPSLQLANCINWAWQNGADVINNSWGASGSSLSSPQLNDALAAALASGRAGKGCVVVFAAGNHGSIDYPGNSNAKFLVVGAIDKSANRMVIDAPNSDDLGNNRSNLAVFMSSAIGPQLDVVGPGRAVLSLGISTDSNNPNNTTTMSGTSMAAPHVAGVAALVLAANPCLTYQQVNYVIEYTAQKVGNFNYLPTSGRPYGIWNNEAGYGLVDAYAAILLGQQLTCGFMYRQGDETGMDSKENTKADRIKVYPNPVQSIVNFEGDDLSKYSISIYDQNGNPVMAKDTLEDSINMGQQEKGMYIYIISGANDYRQVGKLLKE